MTNEEPRKIHPALIFVLYEVSRLLKGIGTAVGFCAEWLETGIRPKKLEQWKAPEKA